VQPSGQPVQPSGQPVQPTGPTTPSSNEDPYTVDQCFRWAEHALRKVIPTFQETNPTIHSVTRDGAYAKCLYLLVWQRIKYYSLQQDYEYPPSASAAYAKEKPRVHAMIDEIVKSFEASAKAKSQIDHASLLTACIRRALKEGAPNDPTDSDIEAVRSKLEASFDRDHYNIVLEAIDYIISISPDAASKPTDDAAKQDKDGQATQKTSAKPDDTQTSAAAVNDVIQGDSASTGRPGKTGTTESSDFEGIGALIMSLGAMRLRMLGMILLIILCALSPKLYSSMFSTASNNTTETFETSPSDPITATQLGRMYTRLNDMDITDLMPLHFIGYDSSIDQGVNAVLARLRGDMLVNSVASLCAIVATMVVAARSRVHCNDNRRSKRQWWATADNAIGGIGLLGAMSYGTRSWWQDLTRTSMEDSLIDTLDRYP